MEYAKDNIIKLHTLPQKNQKEEKTTTKKGTRSLLKSIRKHKLISTILIMLLFFSIINTILIYSFFKILTTI